MKRILSLLVVTLLSFFSIHAQKLENSTLWKIEGNGLDNPSYLFGTIHITCDATIDEDVEQALAVTTQVVLELDMDDPNLQAKMMKGMYIHPRPKSRSNLVRQIGISRDKFNDSFR